MNGPNKLECYITLVLKDLPRTKKSSFFGPFLSYEENKVMRMWLGSIFKISQCFIFFVAYKQAQQARVSHSTRLFHCSHHKSLKFFPGFTLFVKVCLRDNQWYFIIKTCMYNNERLVCYCFSRTQIHVPLSLTFSVPKERPRSWYTW